MAAGEVRVDIYLQAGATALLNPFAKSSRIRANRKQ